jgi:hypothetical protein
LPGLVRLEGGRDAGRLIGDSGFSAAMTEPLASFTSPVIVAERICADKENGNSNVAPRNNLMAISLLGDMRNLLNYAVLQILHPESVGKKR